MRVAIIAGGRTPERDVSLRSGQRVNHALAEGGHDAWVVGDEPCVQVDFTGMETYAKKG